MKNIKLYCCLILLLGIASCRKNVSNALIGSWRVDLSLADTSKRCAVFVETATQNKSYVIFKADGTLGGNAFPQYTKYQTGDNSSLFLFQPDGKSIELVYSINKNLLQIGVPFRYFTTPGCGLDTYIKSN